MFKKFDIYYIGIALIQIFGQLTEKDIEKIFNTPDAGQLLARCPQQYAQATHPRLCINLINLDNKRVLRKVAKITDGPIDLIFHMVRMDPKQLASIDQAISMCRAFMAGKNVNITPPQTVSSRAQPECLSSCSGLECNAQCHFSSTSFSRPDVCQKADESVEQFKETFYKREL